MEMRKIRCVGIMAVASESARLPEERVDYRNRHGQADTAAPHGSTTPAPAKPADSKTGKQLMVGKWKLKKAVIDGTDMTKEMGEGSVMTITETSMTQKR